VTPVTAALMHRTAKYFIIFLPKCFVPAMAAVRAELRAIFLNKICKILLFLCRFVNSVHDGQYCTCRSVLCKILHAQNCRIQFWRTYI